MCKHSLDDMGGGGVNNLGYGIPMPTVELLAAITQNHIDFVSDECQSREIYTATGLLTASQTLPLTAVSLVLI